MTSATIITRYIHQAISSLVTLCFLFTICHRVLGYDHIEDDIAVTALDAQAVLLLVPDGEDIPEPASYY